MKKLIYCLAFILFISISNSYAQIGHTAGVGVPTGACVTGITSYINVTTGDYYDCVASAWHLTTSSVGNMTTIPSTSPTWTGIHIFSPAARSSGTAPYFTLNIPADTLQTAATESIGIKTVTATRQWATSGTVALQRENFFAGPTYSSQNASTTFTDAFTFYITPPIAGTNAIFTRGHTLAIVDATSAASSITGGFIVATTLGTAATSVGIGGGNINAGGIITGNTLVSGVSTGTAPFTVSSTTQVSNLNVSQLVGATWVAPGTIGSTTPSTGAFTSLNAGTGKWNVNTGGLPTQSNNLTLAGQGFTLILGLTSQKAETTTADANVLTVTPPAAVGTYKVCTAISVASATSGIISWTLSWTDSNGNAQSNIAQQIFQMGTAAPNTTFTTSAAGNYYGCSMIDINNGAANIVVKWVGGGTTSAKMSAIVERLN